MRSPDGPAGSPERRKILVIDGEQSVIELLADLFESEGYAVTTSNEVQDAVQSIGEAEPDLFILDPWIDGVARWELLDRVKDDPDTAQIPSIVYSAEVAELDRRHARLSARGYVTLPKPFDLDALDDMVERLIGPRRSVSGEGPASRAV